MSQLISEWGQPAREWSRGDTSDIDGRTDRSNGAFGKSDIERKTAREAASELGKERVSNEWERMSQNFRSWFHRLVRRRLFDFADSGQERVLECKCARSRQ